MSYWFMSRHYQGPCKISDNLSYCKKREQFSQWINRVPLIFLRTTNWKKIHYWLIFNSWKDMKEVPSRSFNAETIEYCKRKKISFCNELLDRISWIIDAPRNLKELLIIQVLQIQFSLGICRVGEWVWGWGLGLGLPIHFSHLTTWKKLNYWLAKWDLNSWEGESVSFFFFEGEREREREAFGV